MLVRVMIDVLDERVKDPWQNILDCFFDTVVQFRVTSRFLFRVEITGLLLNV